MAILKKQQKITQIFRKGNTKQPDDCDDLKEELLQLEQKLQDKHDELFQLQRNTYRKKKTDRLKKRAELFIRPEKIILSNSVESLKCKLKLLSMVTGMEVQSYVSDEHCCVVYHMQRGTEEHKHGLRIDMTSDGNVVSKSSLPVGFNIEAVMEDFDNVMMPECLCAIGKALVAYYDRLTQFESLQNLRMQAELLKYLDGSHIEITFYAQSLVDEEEEKFKIQLSLNYRVYDIRPKISFKESVLTSTELPEEVADVIRQQCAVFKRKPLNKAFKEAFLDGIARYKLVPKFLPKRRQEKAMSKSKRFRPNKQNYNIDDTFHPEDCSDQSDVLVDDITTLLWN